MNTYYTTRDFEFLRNRPVVLLDDLKAEIDKLQEKLERAALNESADVSREIEDGNKIASLETALAAANERIAQRGRQIDAFNSGGFADADAMAEKYLDLRIENDKFKQALADIQEIADRETSAEHRLLEEIIQCSMDALAVPGARTSS